ncbi:YlaI family protein [Falsibacillus pallidus]|uniref:YlaI family protein n=1 Tax=Falsibacillus pallidus TaxID=493781 RepID=UPI003D96BAE2
MRVKCVLCEKIDNLHDDTLEAKRLRNRPIHTYMCSECTERITEKTNERIATGNFKLYRPIKVAEDF